MKKIIVIALMLAMTIAFCACGVPKTTADPELQEIAGGWEISNDKTVTAEMRGFFDKAFEDRTGVNYEPLELIATQVVAGKNYKFLCNGTTVTAHPVTKQYEVVIYVDLSGTSSVLSIEELVINK